MNHRGVPEGYEIHAELGDGHDYIIRHKQTGKLYDWSNFKPKQMKQVSRVPKEFMKKAQLTFGRKSARNALLGAGIGAGGAITGAALGSLAGAIPLISHNSREEKAYQNKVDSLFKAQTGRPNTSSKDARRTYNEVMDRLFKG